LEIIHSKKKGCAEKKRVNYYPFGLEHKGYNNVVNGTEYNYQTYQGQEISKELGYNMLEFKYRHYDPAIGRFVAIDPLASDYVYNSTYAFQENKLGLGVELEGLELLERISNGVQQFLHGAQDLTTNKTIGEASRSVAKAQTSSSQEQGQIDARGDAITAKAINDIGEGGIEAVKGGTQAIATVMEDTGDAISLAGVATGLPPLVAAGETISGAGTILNVAVDLSDGKSMTDIAIDKAPSLILGRIGGAANRSITKNANPSDLIDGTTNTAKTIIQSNIMVYDKLIIPAVQTKLKEKKN